MISTIGLPGFNRNQANWPSTGEETAAFVIIPRTKKSPFQGQYKPFLKGYIKAYYKIEV